MNSVTISFKFHEHFSHSNSITTKTLYLHTFIHCTFCLMQLKIISFGCKSSYIYSLNLTSNCKWRYLSVCISVFWMTAHPVNFKLGRCVTEDAMKCSANCEILWMSVYWKTTDFSTRYLTWRKDWNYTTKAVQHMYSLECAPGSATGISWEQKRSMPSLWNTVFSQTNKSFEYNILE